MIFLAIYTRVALKNSYIWNITIPQQEKGTNIRAQLVPGSIVKYLSYFNMSACLFAVCLSGGEGGRFHDYSSRTDHNLSCWFFNVFFLYFKYLNFLLFAIYKKKSSLPS